MKKVLFSAAPEVLITLGAWFYVPLGVAVIVTAVCVFVSVNVYKALENG